MASGVDDDVFQQLMDAVTRFARERLIPAERQVEEENEVPAEIIADMREMGLFGLSTPRNSAASASAPPRRRS